LLCFHDLLCGRFSPGFQPFFTIPVGWLWNINAWETLRSRFTESELVYWDWPVAKIPIEPPEPDQLWEY
jgi:hypothetical protein